MQYRKLAPFFTQGLVVGLAIGLAFILYVSTKDNISNRPTVEFKEINRSSNNASSISSNQVSYADAVELATPAVVNIHTTKVVTRRIHPFFDDPAIRRFFGDSILPPRKKLETSLGSGVIVSDQGYLLTNNHVIEDADEILVALIDGRSAEAVVVGTDPDTDLAVLKISLDQLPSITLGHSDALRIGDVVLAIGNPFGVGQAVSQGIVSATGRHQLGIATFENFIQTDAAINPGNSGGALINTHGEMIGINTAIFSRSGGSQGIGFAIPVNIAKTVMTQIIEHGHTIRGWLGVEIQTLTSILAESFGLPNTKGVIIAGIMRNGPADHAGLVAGDIITQINQQTVNDANDALNLIAQTPPGTSISLQGLRNGNEITVEAVVSSRTQQQ